MDGISASSVITVCPEVVTASQILHFHGTLDVFAATIAAQETCSHPGFDALEEQRKLGAPDPQNQR